MYLKVEIRVGKKKNIIVIISMLLIMKKLILNIKVKLVWRNQKDNLNKKDEYKTNEYTFLFRFLILLF
jgi:hypothetical protein